MKIAIASPDSEVVRPWVRTLVCGHAWITTVA